jgi:WD40 repeat protein/tRNA A-37 threonylcarbamoyl transferase component Bud32
MSYCINPNCPNRQNPDDFKCCQACGTPLLVKNRYRLVQPLRTLERSLYIEVFEVDRQGTPKVLKVLKNNDDILLRLFKREADVLISLNYQGIPQVEPGEYFTVELLNNQRQLHCLVMEKIAGQDLEKYLQEHGAISEKLALNWLEQLAKILHEVHQKSLFHRDIKPSNIMLQPDGQLVLIDFGAARWITDTVVENVGDITKVFTHGYAAPEQMEGRALPQSDFFALGRTFVHLLTNKSPQQLSKDLQTKKLIWRDYAPQVSEELADFIDQLMAPSVQNRPGNTTIILQRLKEIRSPSPPPQFNRLGMIFGFSIVLLVGVWIGRNIDTVSPIIPPDPCKSSPYGISAMDFSPDGTHLATASLDKTVRIWKLQGTDKQEKVDCKQHQDGLVAVKFSPPDGKKIATASLDSTARLWTMNNDGKINSRKQPLSHQRTLEYKPPVVAIDFNQNGKYLATASADGMVKIWNTQDERKVDDVNYKKYIKAISLSPDGKNLAVATLDNKADIWGWEADKRIDLPQDNVVELAFHPTNSKLLAVASADGLIKIWEQDTNKFKEIAKINIKPYPTAINFSPDGKFLIILGLNDTRAYLWKWEKNTNDQILTLRHNDIVVSAAFNPTLIDNNYLLATASNNGTVRLWDSDAITLSICDRTVNNLVAIAVNPKNTNFLATSSAEGQINLIDISKKCN